MIVNLEDSDFVSLVRGDKRQSQRTSWRKVDLKVFVIKPIVVRYQIVLSEDSCHDRQSCLQPTS